MTENTITVLGVTKYSAVPLLPGPAAQSILSPTADPGLASLIPARSHTFMEIYHELISTVILLFPRFQEGLLFVTSESMCMKYW